MALFSFTYPATPTVCEQNPSETYYLQRAEGGEGKSDIQILNLPLKTGASSPRTALFCMPLLESHPSGHLNTLRAIRLKGKGRHRTIYYPLREKEE